MTRTLHKHSETRLAQWELIERALLALRWFALVIVFDLSFFDPSTEGVLVPPLHLILVLAAYNLLVVLVREHFRSRRGALGLRAVDTLVATLAVYLTGGVHSSFFILYYFVILGTALYMNLVPAILMTMLAALLYLVTCLTVAAGVFTPATANLLAIKLTLLVAIGLIFAILAEGLRRERYETEREAVLATHLAVLNDLFRQLTSSLDLERVLQTNAQAACRLLQSDIAAIFLLEEDGRHVYIAAAEGLRGDRLPEERWAVGELPLPRPLETAVLDSNLEREDELPPSLRRVSQQQGVVSRLSVPLMLDDAAIGFLTVAHRTPRTYAEDDMPLLKSLAQQAALAIRNAHLYELEKQQVEQLQTLERLQENFVSIVSHELRTPLTSIKTAVALLQETQGRGPSPVQAELLQTIAQNEGRLEAMVSDLIQMTQLEAGQFALTLQPTDLRAIVERAVQSLRPLYDEKGQTIEVHAPEQMDRIPADRRRLEQVLVNLLSNAHKYAPRGAKVRIDVVDGGGEVEFSVSDNGPGIPLPEQEHIFDKFYVGAEAKNRAGVGLGLYITRELVELFGGRIWVESEPGRGSTFRFTLPKKELTDEDLDR